MRIIQSIFVGLLMTATAASAATVDINACGQTVPPGSTGVASTDLDCGFHTAVTLEAGATLQMNGHTFTHANVECTGRWCTVGGGTIIAGVMGGGLNGIEAAGNVIARDLTIRSGVDGIRTGGPLERRPRVLATNVTIEDCGGNGILAATVQVDGVVVSGSQTYAIQGTGNVTGVGLKTTDNSYGVTTDGKVTLRQLTSTGNAGWGVFGGRVVLTDSTVTGNGGSTPPGADVLSKRPPKLVRTTCGYSWSTGTPRMTWGVCTND